MKIGKDRISNSALLQKETFFLIEIILSLFIVSAKQEEWLFKSPLDRRYLCHIWNTKLHRVMKNKISLERNYINVSWERQERSRMSMKEKKTLWYIFTKRRVNCCYKLQVKKYKTIFWSFEETKDEEKLLRGSPTKNEEKKYCEN